MLTAELPIQAHISWPYMQTITAVRAKLEVDCEKMLKIHVTLILQRDPASNKCMTRSVWPEEIARNSPYSLDD